MKRKISWTRRAADGVKREVRAAVSRGGIRWQFKRADEERWDYDSAPTGEDWDVLEDFLRRKAGRGKGGSLLESVQRLRRADGD